MEYRSGRITHDYTVGGDEPVAEASNWLRELAPPRAGYAPDKPDVRDFHRRDVT